MLEAKKLPFPITMHRSLGEVGRQVQIRLEGILSDTILPSVGEKLREKGFAVSQWGVERCDIDTGKAPRILSFSYSQSGEVVNTKVLLVVDSTSIATITCTPPHHDTTTILISLPLTLLVSVVFAPAVGGGSAPIAAVEVVDLRITHEHPHLSLSMDGGKGWVEVGTYHEPPLAGGYTILHKQEKNFIAVDTLLCKAITSLVSYRAAQPLAAEIRRKLEEKMNGYFREKASVSITPTEKLLLVIGEGLVKFTYFDDVSINFSSPPAGWLATFSFIKQRSRLVSFPISISITIYDNRRVAAEITKPQRFPGDAYITEYFMLEDNIAIPHTAAERLCKYSTLQKVTS